MSGFEPELLTGQQSSDEALRRFRFHVIARRLRLGAAKKFQNLTNCWCKSIDFLRYE